MTAVNDPQFDSAKGDSSVTNAISRIDTLFAHNARIIPNKLHLIGPDGRPQTYAETYDRARRVAGGLVAGGVRKGDRVMLLTGNSFELLEMFVACSLAGAICVPANPLSTGSELLRIGADCAPSALMVQASLLSSIQSQFLARSPMLLIVSQGHSEGWVRYDDLLSSATPLARPVSAAKDDPAVMIYSSGTTGTPKGILLQHYALVENARMMMSVLRYQQADIFLTLLPMYSSFGLLFDVQLAAIAGATVVMMAKFNPDMAVALIQQHRVTCLCGVPTMFAKLLDRSNQTGGDLSSLRLIDVGGGPVGNRLKQDLKRQFGVEVVESYGQTEISPAASVQIPGLPTIEGSTGPVLPGIEVRVVGVDGDDVPQGTAGELLFRCDTFMIGYWNQPELTAQTLRDGWLHTGDIGLVDSGGEIHIKDRIKDMIVSNGNNVYPKEVENAIAEHPAVQSAAVIGVPNEIRGEDIHAFVVLRAGENLTQDEVLSHCSRLIARFKIPRAVHFLDEMPLTASGKIRRFMLREGAARKELNQ